MSSTVACLCMSTPFCRAASQYLLVWQGNVTGVAAGGHSLAVTSLGELYSWGRNDSKGGGGGGSPGIADSGQLGGFYRASISAESPGKVRRTSWACLHHAMTLYSTQGLNRDSSKKAVVRNL